MNKTILTVIAISTLFLGFAGSVIYADDEAQERILITLNPGGEKKFTDADDQQPYLVRCLAPQPPAFPVCKIRWFIGSSGNTRFVACLGRQQIGYTASSLADIKKDPELVKAIRDNVCRTDESYNAPEDDGPGTICSNN